MTKSLATGSVVAAIIMFLLGFFFYALFGHHAYAPITEEAAIVIQGAMGDSLPSTGTYMVPPDEEGWMAGPSAIVNYVARGDAPSMNGAMITGFVQFLVIALLIGFALRAIDGSFARKAQAVLFFGIAAAVMMRLGDPIWYGFAWRHSLFQFVADSVIFIAGGLVLARWFTGAQPMRGATASAAAE